MDWIRRSLWLVALLPTAAALAFLSLAASHPEALADRVAGGWSATQWRVDAWLHPGQGECLPGQQALIALVLQTPGANLRYAAALGIVLAILLAWRLSRSVARAAGDGFGSAPLAYLAVSALCLSPIYGQDWLHIERAGVFVPPLALVVASGLLAGERAAAWRMLGAALLGAVAATFHPSGALVGPCLWPTTHACAVHVGRRGLPWAAFVAAAGLSVAIAQWVIGGWHGAASGLAQVVDAPGAFGLLLLEQLGRPWGDLLPDGRWDERAFGALAITALVALPLLPRREGAPSAARWWSCAAWGAAAVALATVRLPGDAQGYARIAFGYGAFLLPIGLVGAAATRFSAGIWAIALGAVCVLSLQEWSSSARMLRHGYARAASVAAAQAMPPGLDDAGVAGLRAYVDADARERLRSAGKVPESRNDLAEAVVAAVGRPSEPDCGLVHGGSPIAIHGIVHVRLDRRPAGAVFAVVTVEGKSELRGGAVLAHQGGLQVTPWRLTWTEALPGGAKVTVLAFEPDGRELVVLGTGSLQDGQWVAEPLPQ